MNKYAEILYGKVMAIYEDERPLTQFRTIFSPTSFFTDVTGQDCEVGYNVTLSQEGGLQLVPPDKVDTTDMTLEELKANKIEILKRLRDTKEVAVIYYNGNLFDYDDKSRDRLTIARQALSDEGGTATITWTTADNQRVSLTVADFAGINAVAAVRSNELHNRYNELKLLVLACENRADVEAITWE